MATLEPAVSSLRASLNLLDSSISILDEGVSDFPRLRKVLQMQQHFELVPETKLRAAQQALAGEITPAVEQLLNAAESYVNQLARKEQSLRARSELLEGRLGTSQQSVDAAQPKAKAMQSRRMSAFGDNRSLQMRRLQQRKDQLQYAIERLEMQSKQKERELRRGMAFVREES